MRNATPIKASKKKVQIDRRGIANAPVANEGHLRLFAFRIDRISVNVVAKSFVFCKISLEPSGANGTFYVDLFGGKTDCAFGEWIGFMLAQLLLASPQGLCCPHRVRKELRCFAPELRCGMLVIAAVAAMLATQAQASDRGRYCPCADRYADCMHEGKGESYCETQN